MRNTRAASRDEWEVVEIDEPSRPVFGFIKEASDGVERVHNYEDSRREIRLTIGWELMLTLILGMLTILLVVLARSL